MNLSSRVLSIAFAGILSGALAACSSGPNVETGAAPPVAVEANEIEAIAQMLDRGEVKAARKRLDAALRHDPMNPSLLVLQQGIAGDAKADLGPTSYPYTVVEGDTMADLAEQFLGNRLKSYQLARYNGLDNPALLDPGQVLRIPGQPARSSSREAAPPTRPTSSAAAASPPKPRSAPAPSAAPETAVSDPVGARRARTAGLTALNKGEVAEAVTLLQRAAALDPSSAAIASDLARARRIAATVRSQR